MPNQSKRLSKHLFGLHPLAAQLATIRSNLRNVNTISYSLYNGNCKINPLHKAKTVTTISQERKDYSEVTSRLRRTGSEGMPTIKQNSTDPI